MSNRKRVFLPMDYFEELQPRLAQTHYTRTENIRSQTQMELELRGAVVLIEEYEETDTEFAKEILSRNGIEVGRDAQDKWMNNTKNLKRWGQFGEDGKLEELASFAHLPPNLVKQMKNHKLDRKQAARLLETWMMDEELRSEYQIKHSAEFFILHGMLLDRMDSLFVPYLPKGCNSFIDFLDSNHSEFRFHLDKKCPEYAKLSSFCEIHKDKLKVSFGMADPSPKKLIKKICDLLFLKNTTELKPAVNENPLFNYVKLSSELAKRYKIRAASADEKKARVYQKVRSIGWDNFDAKESMYFRAFGDFCHIAKRQTAPREIYSDLYELLKKYGGSTPPDDFPRENSNRSVLGEIGKNSEGSRSL